MDIKKKCIFAGFLKWNALRRGKVSECCSNCLIFTDCIEIGKE